MVSYNEASAIRPVLAEIEEAASVLLRSDITLDVLLVDDRSPDETARIALEEAVALDIVIVIKGWECGAQKPSWGRRLGNDHFVRGVMELDDFWKLERGSCQLLDSFDFATHLFSNLTEEADIDELPKVGSNFHHATVDVEVAPLGDEERCRPRVRRFGVAQNRKQPPVDIYVSAAAKQQRPLRIRKMCMKTMRARG